MTPHRLRDPPPRTRLGPLARARARTSSQPDTVLIEGPPEADALLALAAREDMAPPVALLTYVPDEPAPRRLLPVRALLARVARDPLRARPRRPVRFMDLPAANKMADARRATDRARKGFRADPLGGARRGRRPRRPGALVGGRRRVAPRGPRRVRGRDRGDGGAARGLSRTTTRARSGARRTCASRSGRRASRARSDRGRLRRLARAGARRRPAPPRPTSARSRACPRSRSRRPGCRGPTACWRAASGYGAGVDSPAWYDQLFDEADDPGRALAQPRRRGCCAAEGLDASAAQVVDAVRLASALAGHPRPPAGRPGRAARRHPRRALPRLRRAARARARRAGRRPPARRGPRGHADGPAPAGRLAPAAAAAAEARGAGQGAHARPAQARTTASAAGCCTA